MTTMWAVPTQALIDRAPDTMPGLWSLLATACAATSSLSRVPPLDDDLSLTTASHDLLEAMGELEWARPQLPVQGVVIDLGPAPIDDVLGCRAAIASLIIKALRVMAQLLDDPGTTTGEVMSLTRVLQLLSQARGRIVPRDR